MPSEHRFAEERPSFAFERNLAAIFGLLGLLLTGLISSYWLLVLEPSLQADAESRAHALAQAQARSLESLFAIELPPERLVTALDTRLDGILLLREQGTRTPLTDRVELEFDPHATSLPAERLTFVRGEDATCANCFVTEEPLYHPRKHQLIGIASFYANTQSLSALIGDVRSKLFWTGGAVLLLIVLGWLSAGWLLRRLRESETNLRSLLDVAPFPMLLVDQSQTLIIRANLAAIRYLGLSKGADGQLASAAWTRLRDEGLPSEEEGQREMQIRDQEDRPHWAVVSVIQIHLSGTPHRLVSLVDISELKSIQQRLHQAANTDALTRSYNRRYLFERLHQELLQCDREGHRLAVILFDLDEFKSINDTYGHAVGDIVLARAAEVLRQCVRTMDVCGRYGGEEFLVILPSATAKAAFEIAERIRGEISALNWSTPGLRVTISGGVAEYSGGTIDALLEVADRNLYRAKERGRNRIVY
ncbi:MAG: GGDEF domain-containing protein [Halochromatium sp.]